jgi:CRISPR/Cas system-associated exonuclease Cas4 (RecB family)
MSDRPRDGKRFVWTTWITGLLAADNHCAWATWYRAHYFFAKRPESPEREANLARWQNDHVQAVRAKADELEKEGWTVTVEDQNKFFVRGETATLSGCADLVAVRDVGLPKYEAFELTASPAVTATRHAMIVDCKTGERRNGDWWQVAIYLAYAPAALRVLNGVDVLTGRVSYRDGNLDLSSDVLTDDVRRRIGAEVRSAAGATPPPRTPSPRECAYCNILACPDRIDEPISESATEDF